MLSKAQRPIANPQPTDVVPPPNATLTARSSKLQAYVKKRRWVLGIVTVLLIVGLLVGLIVAARKYYLRMSSQGILGPRHVPFQFSTITQSVRAPTILERINRNNVPYYTCGDQLHNCGAFDQPNICCPVKTFCHANSFSSSGIFCCNSTSASDCPVSRDEQPQCLYDMIQCSKLTYGGCCPKDTICAPNGCIKIVAASIVGVEALPYSSTFSVLDGTESTRTGATTATITKRPAATITGVKYGEVPPPSASTGRSLFLDFSLPYTLAALFVIMALVMGFL